MSQAHADPANRPGERQEEAKYLQGQLGWVAAPTPLLADGIIVATSIALLTESRGTWQRTGQLQMRSGTSGGYGRANRQGTLVD
jgi:hypothetical protein